MKLLLVDISSKCPIVLWKAKEDNSKKVAKLKVWYLNRMVDWWTVQLHPDLSQAEHLSHKPLLCVAPSSSPPLFQVKSPPAPPFFFSNWSRLLQKSQGETSSSKSSTIIITFALIMDKVISTIKNSPIYFNSARAGPSCVCGIARESSSRESRDFRTEISAYRADRHYALRVSWWSILTTGAALSSTCSPLGVLLPSTKLGRPSIERALDVLLWFQLHFLLILFCGSYCA